MGDGRGTSINIAWDGPGASDGDYMTAFRYVVLPIAKQWGPDLVIVSAGFDAAQGDPLGECCVTPHAYGHMTAMLAAVAPVVLLLEGGYNLKVRCTSAEIGGAGRVVCRCTAVLLGSGGRGYGVPLHCWVRWGWRAGVLLGQCVWTVDAVVRMEN